MTRLAFHRPARMLLPQLPTEQYTVPVPPEVPEEGPDGGAWNLVLPLLSSVGMAAYMVTFGRPALIIIGVLFFLTSTGAVIALRMRQRRATGKATRKQRLRYRAHLSLARDQAREVSVAQRQVAAVANPEPSRLFSISANRHRVWERRRSDEDFLRVRLGRGLVRLASPMVMDPKMDPIADYDWESLRSARRLVESLGRVEGQPMVVDLGNAGVVSLLGPSLDTENLARVLLCQVATLHAPDDVLIAVETSGERPVEENNDRWQWAKWLPHTIEPRARGTAGVVSLVAADPAGLAAFLNETLRRRVELAGNRRTLGDRQAPADLPRLVVVLTGFAPVSEWGRSDILAALVAAAGPQSGITLVFLVEREADEPSRVDLRIRIGDDGRLTPEGRKDLVVVPAERCLPDTVTPGLAELIARQLAPLRLSDEREQVLTRTTSLTEMVVGGDVLTADIVRHWVPAGDPRMLRSPIGTDGDGQTVVLDLKESAQGGSGPHGLIVGATGSGKSELLRTLATGLALTHSPELLSFVLIDFKGGAAFAPLAGLPHVGGLITNLADDVAMIDRVLAALMGEQQRRQQMLRDAGNIDSVREYQIRRARGGTKPDGSPLEPLPYLLIVVDEFGELLSGRPDFTELFVQIGRVGRSLGMHLLLATQRLEEGRLRGLDSHLSYRICLRTFSAAESRSVIGTPDAYKLPPVPGSAYLKVDESIYVRLRVAHVSSTYVSAQERWAAAGKVDDTVVPFDIRTLGAPAETEPEEPPTPDGDGPTELAVVVDRMKAMEQVHQVWLPPLPKALALDHLIGTLSAQPERGYSAKHWPLSGSLSVPIGLVDLPIRQDQETLMMDFGGAHGHLAVVGAPRTGRSTLLRTLMLAAMLTHTPEEMQFYCIDFGGGTLTPYASAPHVGAVAGRNDPELVSRVVAEIRGLVVERERLFQGLGVESIQDFRAKRRAGELPDGLRAADVFLLVDNWGAMRAEHEWADAALTEIASRGLGAGVHLVLTSGRWNEIRPALRDSIGTRLELRLNDPSESEVARRAAGRLPGDVPGRGLMSPGVYCQFVLPRLDGRDTAEGLREAQEDVLGKIIAGWSGRPAPKVRRLPALVRTRQLAVDRKQPPTAVPIGVAEHDLKPVHLDLSGEDPHFLVYGDAGSGKSTFLRTYLSGLTSRQSAWDARVVLFDFRHSLLDAVPKEHLGAYAGDPATAQAYVGQVADKLRERLPPPGVTPQQLKEQSWWEGPRFYVVVDDYDLVSGGSTGLMSPFAAFVPQAREIGLHMLLARRVAGSSRSVTDPVSNRIRDMGGNGLVLSGDPREGVILGDLRAASRPPGRGVLVNRGKPHRLIQVAVPDEPTEGEQKRDE
ncbi:type VII secretion protein EccCa [Micromonospora sp. WMMD1155]|uniref:type VII secretion protein EccCa n=1 Tax=Micromonospora sp. WMMD1155 TaxID=3016094 RepID=UPI00249A97B9|nr:type VII secretion protein EccCa [Micromonospora sp. WMMD1155]WFE48809.1 type VII secretion protein EccCa [Micromonospora sp. WMMD1155]